MAATQQGVGVIGIVICIALMVAVVIGRNWVVDNVRGLSASVDGALARGETLVTTASAAVDAVSTRTDSITTTANNAASSPGQSVSLGPVLLGEIDQLSSRYMELRNTYADLRQQVVDALDRFNAVARFVPQLSLPESFLDSLKAADARIQDLDAQILAIIDAKPSDALSADAALLIASKSEKVGTALDSLSARIDDTASRISSMRDRLSQRTSQLDLAVTIVSIGMIALLAYLAILHVVLLRLGRANARAQRADRAVLEPLPAANGGADGT